MSYTVFITKFSWVNGVETPIQLEDWVAVAEADPEFEADPDYIGSYLWKSHPREPLFDYYGPIGIGVSYRDGPTFRKMFSIASRLDAILRGEMNEMYRLTENGVEQFYENPLDGDPDIICD